MYTSEIKTTMKCDEPILLIFERLTIFMCIYKIDCKDNNSKRTKKKIKQQKRSAVE